MYMYMYSSIHFNAFYCLTKDFLCPLDNLDGLNVDLFFNE